MWTALRSSEMTGGVASSAAKAHARVMAAMVNFIVIVGCETKVLQMGEVGMRGRRRRR